MASRKRQNIQLLSQYSEPLHEQIVSYPDDVVEKIISFLPTKKVYQLSILSQRFKESYRVCRDMSFDSSFARNLSKDEYKNVVDNFFLRRINLNADRLKLYIDADGEITLISKWIYIAVLMGINELEVDLTPSNRTFTLAYEFILAPCIKKVKLVKCGLHMPAVTNGLHHLTELVFQDIAARPDSIETIFRNFLGLRTLQLINCRKLSAVKVHAQMLQGFKMLVLRDCSDVRSVAINAPVLSSLHYHGKICEFKFLCDFPELKDVILDIKHPRGFDLLPHRKDVVITLRLVKILTVTSAFLEALSVRFEEYDSMEVQFCMWNLKEFHLIVAGESFINPADIVAFLKKCPRVERVFIDLGPNAFGDNMLVWKNHGGSYLSNCNTLFSSIRSVKIKGFTNKELPVTLTRFFLRNTKYLQRLVLVKAKKHYFPPETDAFEYWLRGQTQSRAKIEVYEYLGDSSVVISHHIRDLN